MLAGRVVTPDSVREDYNHLSRTYDEAFSRRVKRHSDAMVERLDVPRSARALDLACGTGAVTLELARRAGTGGRVTAVDASPGMLASARRKVEGVRGAALEFVHADMQQALDSMPDACFDVITCGWAIGYAQPRRLLRTAARKLKPGGRLGIIENRRSTLAPVRRTAFNVAASLPHSVERVMGLHSRLPVGMKHLRKLFLRAGLGVEHAWEGEEAFEFRSGREVLDWVLSTGASAGFDRVMSPEMKQVCDDRFVRFIERDYLADGRIRVAHRFVAGIARRD
jgi:ubiquinone/menaquinone biosynthesis C-methylase UbiE